MNLDSSCWKFVRDDEEWFQHRKIMNNFLLKDYRWIENLIQTACDNFVTRIERTMNDVLDVTIENLEEELYLWSSYCKLCNTKMNCCNFNKFRPFSNN